MEAVKQNAPHVLAQVIGVPLHVREDRVEIYQRGHLHPFEVGRVVAFQRVKGAEAATVQRQPRAIFGLVDGQDSKLAPLSWEADSPKI